MCLQQASHSEKGDEVCDHSYLGPHTCRRLALHYQQRFAVGNASQHNTGCEGSTLQYLLLGRPGWRVHPLIQAEPAHQRSCRAVASRPLP
jgi:hypothetical protein